MNIIPFFRHFFFLFGLSICFSLYPSSLFAQTGPGAPGQGQTAPSLPSENDPTQKGIEFLNAGNLDAAEREFKKALSANPDNHRAYFGLGLVYLQKKEIDQSEKAFHSAVSIQPDYAPAYQKLGEISELKKELAGAVLNYQKAVSLEKVNPAFAPYVAAARFRLSQIGNTPEEALRIKNHLEQGDSFLKARNRPDALKEYQAVLDLAPDQLEALENEATLSFELAKYDEARRALQRIIAINPNVLFAHLLLGNVYESMGEPGEAWEEYQTVIKLGEKTPQFSEVKRAKEKIEQLGPTKEIAREVDSKLKKAGLLLEKEKNLEAAEAAYREILKIVPGNRQAKFGVAAIDFQKENFSEAKQLFSEVIAGEPTHIKAHLLLGEIYRNQKEAQNAFNEFSKVKELINQLGVQKEAKAELEQAERELAQFGNEPARALEIQRLLDEGEALLKSEEIDAAKAKFTQALALSPNNVSAMDHLARIYLRETSLDTQKAKEYFEKIISINPELLLPRIDLALIDQSQGNYDEGIAQLQEVIKQDQKKGELSARANTLLHQMGGTPEKAKALFSYLKSAELLFKEEKWRESKEELQKALDLVPDQIQALYLLARVELKQKNVAEAEKALGALLKADPNHLEGRLQLGLLLGGEGKYNEGAEELEKVITLGKEGKTVQTAKKELESLKQKAGAEEHFKAGLAAMQKLEEMDKESPTEEGKPLPESKIMAIKKAVAEFESAIQMNRDNPYYFYNLGVAYIRNREFVSAEASFKSAIALKPDLIIARYKLAVLYDLAGAVESSLQEYEQVLALGKPEDAEVKEAASKIGDVRKKVSVSEEAKGYSIVGSLLVKMKEYKKAGPLLKKATELVPWLGAYWYDLGNYYEAVQDDDQAVLAYQTAIEKSPNFSSPYFYLGLIQERKGEYREALENFKKAEKYLVNKKSKEAELIQQRLNFYQIRLVGNASVTLFGYDSNSGDTQTDPIAEVYAVYGLNLKYMFYKSLKEILSASIATSNAVYYYSQGLFNSESFSLDGSWPDLYGFSAGLSSSLGISYAAGGFQGWSGSLSGNVQRKAGWFDSLSTHLGYTYSVSAVNPFYDSIQENVSWTFFKNLKKYGGLTGVVGVGNTDVVAEDQSNVSWNAGVTWNQRFLDYYSGSLGVSYGEQRFKNPDSSALTAGFGTVYRKNQSVGLNSSLTWFFYKNITVTATAGWQSVSSNLAALAQNLNDILSHQTFSIGSYQKTTLALSVNYSF